MTRFVPGDFVEAVITETACQGVGIETGRLYVVDLVEPELFRKLRCSGCGDACEGDGIQLADPPLPPTLRWCSSSFKVVYRPNQAALLLELGYKAWRPRYFIAPRLS